MNLPDEYANFVNDIFKQIYNECHSENNDKFLFIQNYTQLLLLITKRHFDNLKWDDISNQDNRATDILLVSRFQSLVETMLSHEDSYSEIRQPSFYANKLSVHPNHLNAVVKIITGKTATSIIQNQFIISAKSLLRQTNLSIKEIAFRLHFSEPTHFNSYFKKVTHLTPQQYREKHIL